MAEKSRTVAQTRKAPPGRPVGAPASLLSVSRAEDGMSLCDLLSLRLKCSKRRAKALLDERRVWVNRQCVWMAHHRLVTGDRVQLPGSAMHPATARPPADIPVLYRDDAFWIVNKPPGLLSTGAHSLESRMREQAGMPALRAAHRLDRETSGCLLLACDAAAFDAAVRVFKAHRVIKNYLAIVVGRYMEPRSTLKAPIEGKTALTHVRCIRHNRVGSYLAIRIDTGRTHQIRRHLADLRHPLAGDRLYGMVRLHNRVDAVRPPDVPRMMLHAQELTMPHPLHAGVLRAHAPLPADFRHALHAFRLLRK